MSKPIIPHPSSYRDPSGFIFEENGMIYRQVNRVYREQFEFLMRSGLYSKLVSKGWLISHERQIENVYNQPDWYTTLKPEQIPFISYPYEWSFDMLKDAALLTLKIAKTSMEHGMMLKDATPYNIQWLKGRFVFIDTLSFEKYDEKEPWIAYRQFCEHFLAPLCLMHYRRQPLHQLMLAYPDGIPLSVASSLLPARTKFNLHVYLHIHLNAKLGSRKSNEKKIVFNKQKLSNIFSSLETLTNKLKLPGRSTNWSGYYKEAAEREDYLEAKKNIVGSWVEKLNVYTAIDLGANDGVFSEIIASKGIATIATEQDPFCVNSLYLKLKDWNDESIQPLVIDLASPSPAIGFNNKERSSFISRAKADLVVALALIHHLAIGRNVPLPMIAELFTKLSQRYLIIEFIPKTDEKVKLMLSGRTDIFDGYHIDEFENVFKKYFSIEQVSAVGSTDRKLYLMTKNV